MFDSRVGRMSPEEKRHIIFLINPISGTKRKNKIINTIQKSVAEKNFLHEVFYTNPEGNYKNLFNKIKNENITDVIIVGGDGTVNQVVAALKFQKINFGIIPIGSGNGLARTAKIPMNINKALDIILNGTSTPINTFKVNEKFACMLVGIGLDAHIAYDFAMDARRGLATYIKHTMKNFFKARSYFFEVEINDKKIKTNAYFISVANANQFGNNFKIAPNAKLNDDLLDVVIVKKMKKIELLTSIFKQILGKNKQINFTEANQSNNKILYFKTPSIFIKNAENAPIHIDGEVSETIKELAIKINEEKVFLLMKN